METTGKRLELINAHYDRAFAVAVSDAFPGAEYPGTEVRLSSE